MAIVIKKIEVKTIVEKKIITETKITDSVYRKIINTVISELKQNQFKPPTRSSKGDRER